MGATAGDNAEYVRLHHADEPLQSTKVRGQNDVGWREPRLNQKMFFSYEMTTICLEKPGLVAPKEMLEKDVDILKVIDDGKFGQFLWSVVRILNFRTK